MAEVRILHEVDGMRFMVDDRWVVDGRTGEPLLISLEEVRLRGPTVAADVQRMCTMLSMDVGMYQRCP